MTARRLPRRRQAGDISTARGPVTMGIARRATLLLAIAVAGVAQPAPGPCHTPYPFGWSEPEAQAVSSQELLELTRWVLQERPPLLSLLISRNGRIVYELYTSSITRSEAHYVMSVTKSVTSALVGVAVGEGLLQGPEQTIANGLPRDVFPNEESYRRFRSVTLKDVLAMSALDAPVAPHLRTVEAQRRLEAFFSAPNRVAFALSQGLLPRLGLDFQYTDVTPSLAAGMVEYNAHATLLDLAKRTLFGPMSFEHEEWMHEDKSRIDNAAYGLRLRPVDMQKFGVLFLNGGCWDGQQLVPRDWVDLSFTPWIRSRPGRPLPDYGWYWWQRDYAGETAHVADGWKGQRIAVLPGKRMVVTMTAIAGDGDEGYIVRSIMERAAAAVSKGSSPTAAADVSHALHTALREVNALRLVPNGAEYRMLPSAKQKERHVAWKE